MPDRMLSIVLNKNIIYIDLELSGEIHPCGSSESGSPLRKVLNSKVGENSANGTL